MGGASTFIGMLVSLVAIVVGIVILGGNISDFVDVPSIMLTVVPTFGALMASYPMETLAGIPSHLKSLMNKSYEPEEYITQIFEMAKLARAEGLLALENGIKEADAFLGYGVRLVVDGADEVAVKNALYGYLKGIEQRHTEVMGIYEKGAAFAPAFGMCATVISLINMLMNLDFSDPTAINSLGGNMSAALVTTFYGCIVANALFLPIAARLKVLHKKEFFCKVLISDGILGLRQGDNPTSLQMMLLEQISPKIKKEKFPEVGGLNG